VRSAPWICRSLGRIDEEEDGTLSWMKMEGENCYGERSIEPPPVSWEGAGCRK